jgi:hypothetical protein
MSIEDRPAVASDGSDATSATPIYDRRWVVSGMVTAAVLPFEALASPSSARPVSPQLVAADACSLVMVEDDGCVYCVRWHREVGDAYAKSAEGRFAPLERRRIRDPEIAFLRNVRYTPTFVLVRSEEEIGRITGYPGADFFWQLLAELLAKAGFNETPAAAPAEDIKT